jgi:hypothetical protein
LLPQPQPPTLFSPAANAAMGNIAATDIIVMSFFMYTPYVRV